jgi:hypothetical protein
MTRCGTCQNCLKWKSLAEDEDATGLRCLNPQPGGGVVDLTPEVDKVLGFDKREQIDHPSHYGGDTTYEAIKVIEAWGLNFSLGCVVKYLVRAKHKGVEIQDLKKAAWYLNREIERLEHEGSKR